MDAKSKFYNMKISGVDQIFADGGIFWNISVPRIVEVVNSDYNIVKFREI